MDGLIDYFSVYLFSFRDPQSLDPPEVSNAKLQYAGWGPKGQQLVSQSSSGTRFELDEVYTLEAESVSGHSVSGFVRATFWKRTPKYLHVYHDHFVFVVVREASWNWDSVLWFPDLIP